MVTWDDPEYWLEPREGGRISFVVAQEFPEPDLVRESVRRAVDQFPEAEFVTSSQPADAIIREELELVRPNHTRIVDGSPYWQAARDHRAIWRAASLINGSTHVVVFRTPNSKVTERYKTQQRFHSNITVIERGKARPKPRKRGRKPVGG